MSKKKKSPAAAARQHAKEIAAAPIEQIQEAAMDEELDPVEIFPGLIIRPLAMNTVRKARLLDPPVRLIEDPQGAITAPNDDLLRDLSVLGWMQSVPIAERNAAIRDGSWEDLAEAIEEQINTAERVRALVDWFVPSLLRAIRLANFAIAEDPGAETGTDPGNS